MSCDFATADVQAGDFEIKLRKFRSRKFALTAQADFAESPRCIELFLPISRRTASSVVCEAFEVMRDSGNAKRKVSFFERLLGN